MTPHDLFRRLAFADAVTWTLLLIGMVLKYATHTTEVMVRVGGGLHGFVFLTYVAVTVLVSRDQRWSLKRTAAGIAAAFVPYLTVPFERWVERTGGVALTWRLRDTEPVGGVEKLTALVVRRPVASALVIAVGLGVVFGVLLRLGPPTSW